MFSIDYNRNLVRYSYNSSVIHFENCILQVLEKVETIQDNKNTKALVSTIRMNSFIPTVMTCLISNIRFFPQRIKYRNH